MTQNTEQKIRTREEQVADAYLNDGDFTLFQEFDRDDFDAQLREVEARGAAEQRRKDAEGERELVDWIFNNLVWYFGREGYQLIEVGDHLPDNCIATIGDLVENHGLTMVDPKTGKSELANVAALEARVKELEASREHLKRLVLDVLQVCHRSKMSPEDVGYAERMIRAALKREGGV